MSHVAVDISGRLDEFGEDTMIGFSNGCQDAIRLPRGLKQEATRLLRQQGKGRAYCKARLYVIGLYLLLRPYGSKITDLTLDKDFAGWEGEITSMLLTFLRRDNSRLTAHDIRFENVEGHRCHIVANGAFRKRFPAFEPDPVEFLKLVPAKKKNRVS